MADFITSIKNMFNLKTQEEKLFELASDSNHFQQKKFFKIINKNEKLTNLSADQYSPVSFVDINAKNNNGDTLLHLLAGKQSGPVILSDYLLTKGADANMLNASGEPALKANINLMGMKDALLVKETNTSLLNKIYNDGETILTALFQKNTHPEQKFIQELINQGADINFSNKQGHTPLYYALFLNSRSMPQTFLTLIENGAFFSEKDIEKINILNHITKHAFLVLGYPNNKKLIEKDKFGDTALFKMLKTPVDYTFAGRFSLFSSSNETIKEHIIDKIIHQSDIHEKDKNGKTALELAVSNRRYQFILPLIAKGADITFKNEKNETLLHTAILRDDEKLLKTLLSRNEIDVNSSDINGNTPLHLAVQKEKINLVETLLKNDANPTIKNKDGSSPLDLSTKISSEIIFLKLQLKKLETENQKLNASLIAHRKNTPLINQNRQHTL